MLDRIDIHIEVPRVDYEKFSDDRLGEPSANVQARVEAARERQWRRFSESTNRRVGEGIACNADMRPAEVRDYCQLDETCNSLMRTAMNQMQLSARACHRVLKLTRTIADLAGGREDCTDSSGRDAAGPSKVGDDVEVFLMQHL